MTAGSTAEPPGDRRSRPEPTFRGTPPFPAAAKSALANAQTPGKGFKGVVEMGNEVLGVVKDKGDLIEAAYDQEYGPKAKKKVD